MTIFSLLCLIRSRSGKVRIWKPPHTVLLLGFVNICALFIISSWRQWTLWRWLPHAGSWPKWTSSSQADGARQQDSITPRVGGTFWPRAELLHDGPFPPNSVCPAEHRQWHLCLDLWGWVRKEKKIKISSQSNSFLLVYLGVIYLILMVSVSPLLLLSSYSPSRVFSSLISNTFCALPPQWK